VNAKPDEREAIWSQARAVAAEFLRRAPPHPGDSRPPAGCFDAAGAG
jgi:hypothetical protein